MIRNFSSLKRFFLVAGVLLSPLAGTAASAQGAAHTIARLTHPITVDGALGEEAWRTATLIPVALEWFPGDNVAAPVTTECLIAYDEESLYVGFRAHDADPSDIRAHMADRDTPVLDDTVGFMLDPFNDRRRAFQFRINPLGVQMDAVNSDVDGSENWSWDAIWDSAGRITTSGYEVEVRIPFTSLRFPRAGDAAQTWGFVAMRDYPRSARHRLQSSPRDRNRSCQICQFDTLTGFTEITPGRNLEIAPTLTGFRGDSRDDITVDPLERGDTHSELGATARWGITPNIIANASINPDFSQVEADSAQLDINTRFALFFPEKRPFFLEGADFFGTPMRAVFTRSVADPSAAVKLTGKEGKNAMGAFFARDAENNLLFPGNQGSDFARLPGDRVTSGVLRYRRDVLETSTLGVLYADRRATGYANQVGGFDGSVRAGEKDSIRFQYLRTATRYPATIASDFAQPARPFQGDGWTVSYNHDSKNWVWFANYEDLDPHFRADSGFVPQVDVRSGEAGLARVFWPQDKSWVDRFEIFLHADRTEDHQGRLTEEGQDLILFYNGPLQSFARLSFSPNREYFDGTTYDILRSGAIFEFRPTGDLALRFGVNRGDAIDYANSREANFITLSGSIEFSLGGRISGEISHLAQRFEVVGGRLFTARLTQGKLFYHLTPRSYLRAIVQDTDISRDPRLYLDPATDRETRRLLTQLLFSYKVNPQTVILAGYSDAFDGFTANGGAPSYDLTRKNRTLFVKLGYAWVM